MKFQSLIKTAAFASCLTLPLAACASDDGSDDEIGDEGTEEEESSGDETTTGEETTDEETTDEEETTGETTEEESTTGGETGRVRLVHMGVFPGDTGTDVDIFVNGAYADITFAFKEGTGYVDLPVGTYDFDIVPAGGTLEDSVFSVPGFEIAAGASYEVFASGYLAPGDGDAAFGVSFFEEDEAGIESGSTRLNVIHSAALGAFSPVDVWVTDENCEPVQEVLPDFDFGQGALNFDVPAGPLSLGLDVGQDDTVDACFLVPDLGADVMINVFAVNTSEGVPSLLAHLPDGSIAEVMPEG